MDYKLQELIKNTLLHTRLLAKEASDHNTNFMLVLLGTYRVSFSVLQDIDFLSVNSNHGASALDLSRKSLEYGLTIEYMIMKGKEKMATRFQNYLYVQVFKDIEFLRSIGQNLSGAKINIPDMINKYNALPKDVQQDKNWAGRNMDGMLQDLFNSGFLKEFDYSRLSQIYIWGNRLNHPNSLVLQNYIGEDDGSTDEFYLRLAMFTALSIHLRLTTRLVDEIRVLEQKNVYEDLVKKVSETFRALDELETS